MSESFYRDLPAHEHFDAVARSALYTGAPGDWQVIITDIRGSTQAIESGRYKEVNLVGASTIMAIKNIAAGTAIPFVFGGDGATLLIPPSLVNKTRETLRFCKSMSKESFGLELRVGMVPVSELLKAGHSVRVLKFRLGGKTDQAMFLGGGLQVAEKWVKDPAPSNPWLLTDSGLPAPDETFKGLECRWKPLKARHDEVVCLLVRSTRPTLEAQEIVYLEVLRKIDEIYGADNRPVAYRSLQLTLQPAALRPEAGVHMSAAQPAQRNARAWHLAFFNFIWRWVFRFRLVVAGTDWGNYRDEVVSNSDDRKFDEMLRMVLDGTKTQRIALTTFLDQQQTAGALVYGMQVSDEALLTCLVFDRQGDHIHFVDGNGGGYALAAKSLKSRMN